MKADSRSRTYVVEGPFAEQFDADIWFGTVAEAVAAGLVEARIGRLVRAQPAQPDLVRITELLRLDSRRSALRESGDDIAARNLLVEVAGGLDELLSGVEEFVLADPAAPRQSVRDALPGLVTISAFRLLPVGEIADLLDVRLSDVEAVFRDVSRPDGLARPRRAEIVRALGALRRELATARTQGSHRRIDRLVAVVTRLFTAVVVAAGAALAAAAAMGEDLFADVVKDSIVALVGIALLTAADGLRGARRRRDPYWRAQVQQDELVGDLENLHDHLLHEDGQYYLCDAAVWRARILVRAHAATIAMLGVRWDRVDQYWRTLTAVAVAASDDRLVREPELLDLLIEHLTALHLPTGPG